MDEVVEKTEVTADENKQTTDEKPSEVATDQAYLNRGEYSSELYKLEIKNLPKNFGFGVSEALFC
jgi:hypothetical protein